MTTLREAAQAVVDFDWRMQMGADPANIVLRGSDLVLLLVLIERLRDAINAEAPAGCGHVGVEEVIAQAQARLIASERAADREITRLRDAIGRFGRRAGGLRVRFEDGRPYVRLPSEWVDDLASVLHPHGVLHPRCEEGVPSEERLARALAWAADGKDGEPDDPADFASGSTHRTVAASALWWLRREEA